MGREQISNDVAKGIWKVIIRFALASIILLMLAAVLAGMLS